MSENELKSWFLQALEQPIEARARFVETCACPADIKERLCELLAADASTTSGWLNSAHRLFGQAGLDGGARELSGRRIGRYELLECIGEGGMSAVYRARTTGGTIPPIVAVKILQMTAHSEHRRRWFEREHRALAALSHPNIARLHEAGIVDGLPFLAMELIEGDTLIHHLQRSRMTLQEALLLFVSICQAVAYAHSRLIVHRDLKPANILVSREGVAKLLDFGISKSLDSDEESTRASRAMLTPEYAAPEQLAGEVITTATDVYALGVILHEILTGRRPPQHGGGRPSDVLLDKSPLRVTRQALRGDIDNIIQRAIDPEPQRRYTHAGEFAEDVQRHLDGRPVVAHPPSRWYVTQKFLRRHRGAAIVTAVLAASTMMALALAIWQAREAQTQLRHAEASRDFLLGLFQAAREDLPEDRKPTISDLIESAESRLGHDQKMRAGLKLELWSMLADISISSNEFESAIRQIDHALELDPYPNGSGSRDALSLLVRRSTATLRMGDAQGAIEALAPLWPRLRSHTDALLVEALSAHTDALFSAGRIDEALNAADEAAEIAASIVPQQKHLAFQARLARGDAYIGAGRYQDGVRLLSDALDGWRNAGLPESDDYASSLQNLAAGYYQLGDLAKSETELKASIALLKRIHPRANSRVADALYGLAAFALARSDFDESERQYREAQSIYQTIFPPIHPQNASIEDALGSLEISRRRFDKAVEHLDKATNVCDHASFVNHPDCGRYWQNLSHAQLKLGRIDLAEAANMRGLQLHERIFGVDSPQVSGSLAGRGSVLLAKGDAQGSLGSFERALAILSTSGQGQTMSAASALRGQSAALHALARSGDAVSALDRADSIASAKSPDDPVHWLASDALRADILAAAGNTAEARVFARRALTRDHDLTGVPATRARLIRELVDDAQRNSAGATH